MKKPPCPGRQGGLGVQGGEKCQARRRRKTSRLPPTPEPSSIAIEPGSGTPVGRLVQVTCAPIEPRSVDPGAGGCTTPLMATVKVEPPAATVCGEGTGLGMVTF